MSDITSRFVDANGLRLHALQAGRGTPLLLLLHGWPEWSHAWRPVMARLTDRYTMTAPDFRGFGDSAKTSLAPSRDATPEQLADDTLALADALGLQRFGLVAHDVGSFVAQTIARRAPERISGLFFFNCAYPGIAARWVEPGHLLETWYQFFHQQPWAAELVGSSREACRIYLHNFLAHWSHRQDWIDDQLEAWVDNFMQPGNLQGGFNWYRSIHAARMAVIEGRSPPPPPIATPTRVLWGAHDPVLKPVWTDRLPEFFSDLQLDLQPDAGHFVHLEAPDAAAEAIATFFDGLARRLPSGA
ncbi:MAG: alpha/beta hydrolase [Piscinibacter sp.]